MSFKLFIYYCAVCGGWAGLFAWGLAEGFHFRDIPSGYGQTIAIACLVGLSLAGAVGTVDALLSSASNQRWLRVGICLAAGFLGGLVGGATGQVLLDQSDGNGAAWKSIGTMALGWIIVGTVIGASVGVFDIVQSLGPGKARGRLTRKLVNGLIGGAAGGALGGLLFEALKACLNSSRTSLAVGLVILGVSVGLLIGLAQVILKDAWIKVEKGSRAGREMMLSKAETTIGRAESSDIGLFRDNAVARAHARILLEGTEYLVADAGSPAGTFLNDRLVTEPTPLRSGDAIRVGDHLLRFGERQKRAKSRG
jgi:hypothetical protein